MRHKIKIKNRSCRSRPALTSLHIFTTFMLAFFALSLLALGKIDSQGIKFLRNFLTKSLSPVMEIAIIPAGYINRTVHRIENIAKIVEEAEKLRQENAELKHFRQRVKKLENELRQLAKLNDAKALFQTENFLTGRLISDANSQFSRSYLIKIGPGHKVNDGLAVLNANGLLGRTIHTGKTVTRVLMLNDPASHVPVLIGKNKIRAIASGTGNQHLYLSYFPEQKKISQGEIAYTSGEGGTFPAGIRIGKINKEQINTLVIPDAQVDNSEFVRILLKNKFNTTASAPKPSQKTTPARKRNKSRSKLASHPALN